MARTLVLDKLVSGRIIISKDNGEKPVVQIEYTVTTADNRNPVSSVFEYSPTAGEQTQLNALFAKLVTLIKSSEGIV